VGRREKGNRIDKKSIPGTDNATLTSLGYDPAQIGVILTIGNASDWAAYQDLVPKLKPVKGRRPQPVDVYHPLLRLYGIKSLYVLKMPIPKRANGVNDL